MPEKVKCAPEIGPPEGSRYGTLATGSEREPRKTELTPVSSGGIGLDSIIPPTAFRRGSFAGRWHLGRGGEWSEDSRCEVRCSASLKTPRTSPPHHRSAWIARQTLGSTESLANATCPSQSSTL